MDYTAADENASPLSPSESDNLPLGLDDDHDADKHLPPKGTLRRKIINLLTCRTAEIILLLLLVLDVVFVMAELEISTKKVCYIEWAEVEAPEKSSGGETTPTTTPPVTTTTTTTSAPSSETFVPTNYEYNATLCSEAPRIDMNCEHGREIFQLPSPFAACPFKVKAELPPALEHAEQAIAVMSFIIIIAFLIELLLLLAAGGPSLFWHHKMYLLDLVVVLVSFIFEAVAFTHPGMSTLTELIVIARCWRFARIVHGVGAATHEDEAKKKKKEEKAKMEEMRKQQESYQDGTTGSELGAPLAAPPLSGRREAQDA